MKPCPPWPICRCGEFRRVHDVLMAGRLFSATHDAWAAVHSMAQCMAMGQAAGTAAALAIEDADGPLGGSAVLAMDQVG